ncbi:MAG: ABC transporter permease [Candidatus Acidiferrales bacterium]
MRPKHWIYTVPLRLRSLFRRRVTDQELDEELQYHLECRTQENIARGMIPQEARREALLEMGGVEKRKEECREARKVNWLQNVTQDIRYGLRMLRKSPGFTLAAVLTIALGIGATTAIFSVVDATLLHPLPYPHPEQLVSVEDDLPGVGAQSVGISVPEWQDFERSGIFQHVSPIGGGSVNLTGSSQPMRIFFAAVPPNYFALIGVNSQLGRSFNPEDHTPGFTLECLISDGLWKRAFGADPQILGRSVRLDNDLYQIIGVMPAGYHDPGRTKEERNTEMWLATGFAGPPAPLPQRNLRILPNTIARIAPGLTVKTAQSRLDALVASLQKQFPVDYPEQSAWMVRLVPLQETVVGNARQLLILLLGAVGLVLLIGCVNVANLLLARASARGREMAVRQALGAARTRLIAQLLTEGLLLSLVGGIAGLAILFCTRGFLVRLVPDSLPRLNNISINWPVLLFAFAATIAAGLIFGLAPALHIGRPDLTRVFKQEGRGSTGSGEQARTRRVLVITEFALSLVLMIAAGLLLRSFADLLNVRPGFDSQNVMAVRTWLPVPNDPDTDIYGTTAQEAPFVRELIRRSRAMPGVKEAAVGDLAAIPLGHGRNDLNPYRMTLEGREIQSEQAPLVEVSEVTPEYFHLLSMPLQRGRLFAEMDNEQAPPVAVINESFARTYWPVGDPIGKHVQLNRMRGSRGHPPWTTIVGVIADARTESLAEESTPQIYLSLYQMHPKDLAIFLRGKLDPATTPAELRRQVQSVNPELPVFGAQTLAEAVSASLSERRFSMEIVGLFALTALLLAGLGIYGVISYIVSERRHEIGIRLALGAQNRNILRMVLREGLGLAITGAVIGLTCALIVSRLMAGLLYGVRPTDPLTFAGVALLLIAVGLLACYIPARRAMRVDPIVALRYE